MAVYYSVLLANNNNNNCYKTGLSSWHNQQQFPEQQPVNRLPVRTEKIRLADKQKLKSSKAKRSGWDGVGEPVDLIVCDVPTCLW